VLAFLQGCLVALIVLAAAWDVRERRIPNGVSGGVALLGLVCASLSGGVWLALSGLGATALTIALGYLPWKAGRIGGGDVKLGAAAAAALGLGRLAEYLLVTALIGATVAVVCWFLSSQRARQEVVLNLKVAAAGVMPEPALRGGDGRVSVPYGVAFSAAALWILFAGRGW
jgi:prepilin peptidase CpaA